MDTLTQIVEHIVKEQELIIGPLAREEAARVSNIVVRDNGTVLMTGDNKKAAIDQLVARYERLFGQASVQVCKDAAASFLPSLKTGETPDSLK
ncbi:MAG: hypothetical protein A3J93_01610 [Candidatus Magasanikbacteria bacterium RIFOXYC2_FULL_42_28]|uniref:Uncharacterized protein n=1 Tax=Candidatus Magasanikbacteria bacterium RIFOXYC2_FULL_42_28 TaxID=1798704 RepID=A0A1F6NY16_9BACT|nr:MAG: hypothetical protein A3J93_01610 [Candidatus Magasanikbacteria bacterium RIFOXYC2_FULL_42_28]